MKTKKKAPKLVAKMLAPANAARKRSIRKRRTEALPLALFWCEADDHDEDWFVVARSEREARILFADAGSYDHPDEVIARSVCAIPARTRGGPSDVRAPRVGLASGVLVRSLGGVLVGGNKRDGRIIRIGKKVYAEGSFPQNQRRAQGWRAGLH